MPTLSYKGYEVDFDHQPNQAEVDQTIKYIESLPAKGAVESSKTTVGEDIEIGLKNTRNTVETGVGLVQAGLADKLFGNTDNADKILTDLEKRQAAHKAEMATKNQGMGGKIISGVAGVVPAIAAAPFIGPTAAMGFLAGAGALENTQEDIKGGSTMGTGTAIAKTVADAGLNTAAMAIPAGKGLLQGAALGAGGNVVAQAATDVIGQSVTQGTEAAKRYEFEGEKYGVTAAVGAIFGGAVGSMVRKSKTSNAPAAEGPPNAAKSPADLTPDDIARTRLQTETRAMLSQTDTLTRLQQLPKPEDPAQAEKLQKAIDIAQEKLNDIKTNVNGYTKWLNRNNPDAIPEETNPVPAKEPTKEESAPVVKQAVDEVVKEVPPPEDPAQLPLFPDAETIAKDKHVMDSEYIIRNKEDPLFEAALKKDGHDGAFEYIKGMKNDSGDVISGETSWGIVADWFQKNQWIRPALSLWDDLSTADKAYVEKENVAGFHKKLTGRIGFSEVGQRSPETYLHEVTHAATSRLVDLVVQHRNAVLITDATKRAALQAEIANLPKGVLDAANNIVSLRQGLLRQLSQKDLDIFGKQLSNDHEFIAYGLTDPYFQAWLSRIKVEPKHISGLEQGKSIVFPFVAKGMNALQYLRLKIKEALGISPMNRKLITAFDVLLASGKTVVDASTGKPLTNVERGAFGMPLIEDAYASADNQKNRIESMLRTIPLSVKPNLDFGKVKTAALEAPDSPSYWFSKWAYGKQQNGEMMKQHPLIHQTLRALRLAENEQAEFSNYYMFGDPQSGDRKRFGMLVSLQKIEQGGSLAHLIKNADLKDWGAVRKLMHWAGENRVDHATVLAKHAKHLTPSERSLYEGLAAAMDRARDSENSVLKRYGGKPHNFFPGYHPLVHKGDFEVMSTYFGAPLYIESFRTKAEAVDFSSKLRADPTWGKTKIEFFDKQEEKLSTPTRIQEQKAVIKQLEDSVSRGKTDPQELNDARRKLISLTEKGGIGGHGLRRVGVPGAEGNKLFRAGKDLDVEFRQSFLDFGDEIGSLVHKKLINRFTDQILLDPELQGRRPNQVAVVQHLRDMATNDFHTIAEQQQNGFRNWIDTSVIKALHTVGLDKYYPKNHVYDRTVGVATHLFYISTLTTRPGFWAAQVLSSPQAVRQLFKTGTTTDALTSLGKGMLNVFSGGDADFQKAVHEVASKLNTFHPQFVKEINSIGLSDYSMLGGNPFGKALRNVLPWATGEKVAGTADAVSRYMTFAMFYEHYKSQGLRGESLWKAAAVDTDSTMVMYNNPNRAPWIRKMGVAGELVAPLQTYATAQIGNMVADIRHIAREKSIKSTLPLITTALTTMAMGGAIGLPFIVEWEAIRRIAIWVDKENESLWSFTDLLSRDEVMNNRVGGVQLPGPKGAFTFGLPSAATQYLPGMSSGLDIGSGLRWNAVISRALTEDQSLLTMFPAIEFGRQLADHFITLGKSEEGLNTDMVSESKQRTAAMKLGSFLVGGKGAVDVGFFDADTRAMVPGGNRGYAQRPQTTEETLSPFIGSSSISAAHQRNVEKVTKRDETLRTERRQTAIDYVVDGLEKGNQFKITEGIKKLVDLGVDSKEIDAQLEAAYEKRGTPSRDRFYMDSKGRVKSKEQQRKYEYQRRFYGD